jgi:GGDEF domain-containing protein
LSYEYGDNYIQRTATKIKDHIDSKKTEIYRRGGDEFVLIVEGITSAEELDTIGQRLSGVFSGGNESDDGGVIPTVAIGGVFVAQDNQLENALTQAEAAMKFTKRQSAIMTDEYKTTQFHQQDASVSFQFAPSSYQRFDMANSAMTALIPKAPAATLVK